MYKLLLSWRYLRTRYIALASIISVTLGVATMIVVNSVMEGFTQEMHNRLHGILSDLVFESHSLDGLPDPQWHEEEIRKTLGDQVAGHDADRASAGDAQFSSPRPVDHAAGQLDRHRREHVCPGRRFQPVPAASGEPVESSASCCARRVTTGVWRKPAGPTGETGWRTSGPSRSKCGRSKRRGRSSPAARARRPPNRRHRPVIRTAAAPADPYAATTAAAGDAQVFDEGKEQHTGVILGLMVASVRHRDADEVVRDYFLCRPGDDVNLTFPTAAAVRRSAVGPDAKFTVVDLYESKMSEYDSSFAFVPLARTAADARHDRSRRRRSPASRRSRSACGRAADLTRSATRCCAGFRPTSTRIGIQTWTDMQGPLLAAVQMETTILNILLFLIIAVAGFGILATFFMIVVEKTRDIGILKSLGRAERRA